MFKSSAAGLARAVACAASLAALLHGEALADGPAPALAATTSMPSTAAAPPASAPLVSSEPLAARRKHILGLQLDAGMPDGAAVSVLYRPVRYVRFSGGMLYNLASYGVRGGVSVQPYFPIAPSLSLEAGHYFNGNAYDKLSKYTHIDENLKPLMSDVGYTFASASVGLELGHPDWFVFFVRGGLSKLWVNVKNANGSKPAPKPGDDFQLSYIGDPSIKLGIPNVKLGFMLFFY
jgi:hypothetical protein